MAVEQIAELRVGQFTDADERLLVCNALEAALECSNEGSLDVEQSQSVR